MSYVDELAARQAGVVSTAQLRAAAVSWSTMRAQLAARRWRRAHPGVYSVTTGPLTELARVWAAVLWAGNQAVVRHESAAWLWGLQERLPPTVAIAVPHGCPRRTRAPGVHVVQSRRLAAITHPARRPPVTTVEDTVLDLIGGARAERQVIDLVLRVCQQRHTSPSRLAAAAAARGRLRWRALVRDLLLEVSDGVSTPLERRYVRDVETPHGLPQGRRNEAEGPPGHRRYRDVHYRPWRLVVELDGRAAHPEDERELDDLRDNDVALRLERTLRYGWRSVSGSGCLVAAQVAAMLAHGGWSGRIRPCGPRCLAAEVPSTDALMTESRRNRIH